MGLDITAYRQILPDPAAPLDEYGAANWQTHFTPGAGYEWSEATWPGRAPGLQEGTPYRFAESLGFRAGSYSGYGEFRSELAKIAGFKNSQDYWDHAVGNEPFYELINFADNEGVIGAATAAELAKDFADYQVAADSIGDWFLEMYSLWRRACEMAADGGAINFH